MSSLVGMIFHWYVDLLYGSIRTFIELEQLFTKHFASVYQKVTICDLIIEK